MSAARIPCLVLACLLMVSALAAAPATAAPANASRGAVEISIDRTSVTTGLGESFGFSSTITNPGPRPLTGLVAHLNVVGLNENIYVDPEDWSEERTRFLAPLAPGQSTDLSWTVKAVTGGEAAIYIVVLPGRDSATAAEGPAASPALDVRITERRTLNPDGVLPLALGVPALLGLATLALRIRQR